MLFLVNQRSNLMVDSKTKVEVGVNLVRTAVGLLHSIIDAKLVAVQPGPILNCGEFAGIKKRLVDGLPDAEEFDGVTAAQPVGNEEIAMAGRRKPTAFQR